MCTQHLLSSQERYWDEEVGLLQHIQAPLISSMEPSSGCFRDVSVLPSPESLITVRISCFSSSTSMAGAGGLTSSPCIGDDGKRTKGTSLPGWNMAGAAAGHPWDLTLLHSSLCTPAKVRLSQSLDKCLRLDVSRLCFSLHNRFFPLRMQKIDSLAGRIAEPSHVQMVCTSAFFTALV